MYSDVVQIVACRTKRKRTERTPRATGEQSADYMTPGQREPISAHPRVRATLGFTVRGFAKPCENSESRLLSHLSNTNRFGAFFFGEARSAARITPRFPTEPGELLLVAYRQRTHAEPR